MHKNAKMRESCDFIINLLNPSGSDVKRQNTSNSKTFDAICNL